MLIELRKVSHTNKGAELMLRAMVAHYEGREDVRFCGRARIAPPNRRGDLGISRLLYGAHRGHFYTSPRALPWASWRRAMGRVHPSEVDVVLDGAGFAYGDQWGPDNARQAARYFRYVRRHGAKVVLLPQSLGPFTRADVRAAARAMLDHVDLVFPRDRTAMAAVTELVGPRESIVQCPDFTPLVHGDLPAGTQLPENPAAIIPNQKMIEMGVATPEAYEDFVLTVIEVFRAQGYGPFLLPHATQDGPLVARLQERAPVDLPVVVEDDALRLKGIIGACRVAMCSRFHGLVSALCQGVPSVATSWSHKYEHLVDEYACPDALFDVNAPSTETQERLMAMLAPSQLEARRATLAERARWHRDQASTMWQQVDTLTCG